MEGSSKAMCFFFAGPSDWPWFAGHVCLAPLRWNTALARPNCSPWTQNRLAVLFVLLSWLSNIKSACISVLFILSLGFDMSCLIGFKNAKAIACYCLIPRLIRSIEEIEAGVKSGLPVPIVSTPSPVLNTKGFEGPQAQREQPKYRAMQITYYPSYHLTLWSIAPIPESIQEYPWMIRQLPHRILRARKQERFHEVREEISKLHNETQDHGVYRTALSCLVYCTYDNYCT